MLSPEELRELKASLEEKRRRREQQRRLLRKRIIVYSAVGLAVALLTACITYWYNRPWGLAARIEEGYYGQGSNRVHILVMGADSRAADGGRTDTLMVVSVDPYTGDVGVLSIPRDTRVPIPGRRELERVNHAHAHGGPQLVKQVVESLLQIDIHYWVRLNFEAFQGIVDTVGGVEIDVPFRMQYADLAQNLFIDIEPGLQRMDGEKALQFVRYRGSLGDAAQVSADPDVYAGRVMRQLEFVQALAKAALRPSLIARAPQLVRQFLDAVDTDLTLDAALHLASISSKIDWARVETAVVPGTSAVINGSSYWIHHPGRTRQVVDRVVRGLPTSSQANVQAGSGGGRS